jgi:tRNA (Thr-GGU) A37 N-methylase
VTFRPIGIIRSPFVDTEGISIQATAAVGVRGRIELDPNRVEGLATSTGSAT